MRDGRTRVCDYLIVLAGSRVQVAGPIDELLAIHHRLSGPRHRRGRARSEGPSLPVGQEVITESHTDVQSTLLVRHASPVLDPSWSVSDISLEDLVLAYISRNSRAGTEASHTLKVAS